jgi:uncharacterized membrane protein
MSTFDPALADRLDELFHRLSRLEEFRDRVEPILRRLQPSQTAPDEARSVAAPLAEELSPQVDAPRAPRRPAVAPPTSLAPPTSVEAAARLRPPAARPRTPTSDDLIDAWSVERLIGGRWLAAAGALIVVVGVGLFLKLAYDLGWFGHLPPWARCAAGAAFGGVLLIAGEFVRRRVNPLASVGLFAAGLGAIYASAYSAHALYHLVDAGGVTLLLTGCIVLGLLIGAITNLAAVAVVSLLGAYLTPILLYRAPATPWFLPFYLLSLLAIALGLSAWKGPTHPWFTSLRALAWWATMVLGGIWTLSAGVDNWMIALVFLWLVWSLTHAERFFAALHDAAPSIEKPRLNESSSTEADAYSSAPVTFTDVRLLIGSLSTTAWTALLAVVVLDSSNAAARWIAPTVLALACAALAFRFAGALRVLIDVPRTAVQRLGAGMLVQASGLVIAAVALAFTGWPQVAAWLALGLAAVAAGRWINTRALDYYGMVVLSLAAGSLGVLVLLDQAAPPLHVWQGLAVTPWSWRIALTAAAWLLASGLMLIRNPAPIPARAILASIAGLAGLLLICAHRQTEATSFVCQSLAVAAAAIAASRALPRLLLHASAQGVLAIATVAWLLAYPFPRWNNSTAPPFVHPGLLTAIGISLAILLACRFTALAVAGEPVARRVILSFGWWFAGLFALLASSLEVARLAERLASDPAVQRSAVSMYWGLAAVALLALGFLRRLPIVRYAGLALINLAAIKAVVIDLAGAAPAWRIASFIALGLLMIATAVGYARLASKVDRPRAPA